MNIVCISSFPSAALRKCGHNVLDLHPAPGLHSLQALLAPHDFIPDAVFQDENLGSRILLTDLPTFSCVKIFRSLDSHLNMFWHYLYGRLFDTVLTPHLALHAREDAKRRLPHLVRMAKEGNARAFRPHAERGHMLGFVGRISAERSARQNMLRLLAPYNLVMRDDLTREAMLHAYDDVRVLPNESLCGEVNFRLMEGASCGCCLVTGNIGEDQDVLLEPEKECLVYSDGLELLEILDRLVARPEEAERIGRAAWKRIQAEHLPEHRAETLVRTMEHAGRAASGEDAAVLLALSITQLVRCGIFIEDPGRTDARLRVFPPRPSTLTARVQIASENGDENLRDALLREILLSGIGADELETAGVCSFAAVFARDLQLAEQFRQRYHRARGMEAPLAAQSPYHLCLLWAQEYRRAGKIAQPGLPVKEKSCPESAVEALLLAGRFAGSDSEWRRRLTEPDCMPRLYPQVLLDALRALRREDPQNWRLALREAFVCFENFALPQGEQALIEAWNAACICGRDRDFSALLHEAPAARRALLRLAL